MRERQAKLMASRLEQAHTLAHDDYQKSCRKNGIFFRYNHLPHLPENRDTPILEIGCGLGQFLAFCRDSGYKNAAGVDLSSSNVEFCRSHDLNAVEADAGEFLSSTDTRYGAIVMNDVIEHYRKDDVWTILELIQQRLLPGGAIILKTINMANPIMGNHSRYIDFTHEVGWTEESMRQVLSLAGFATVEVTESNLYVYYSNPVNYVAMALTWLFRMGFIAYYRLNGRSTTRVFSKNLIAIGRTAKSDTVSRNN